MNNLTWINAGWLLLVLATIIQLGPMLTGEGMNVAGLHHASIARNMAEETGGFWKPILTRVPEYIYYEELPMGFFIQSLFFRITGDGVYVEKIYSVLCFLLIVLLLALSYRKLYSNNSLLFLPALLFIIVPVAAWTFSNNLLEINLTLFALFGIWAYLEFLSSENWWYFFIGIVAIIFAFFTKGLQASFLLFLPLLSIGIKNKNPHATYRFSPFLMVILPILSITIILYFNSEARNYVLNQYVTIQYLESLPDETQKSQRIEYLWNMVRDCAIPIGIIIAILMISKIQRFEFSRPALKASIILMAIAVIGLAIPLYLWRPPIHAMTPSIALFMLGLSGLVPKSFLEHFYQYKMIGKTVTAFVLMGIILFSGFLLLSFGRLNRDQDKIPIVTQFRKQVVLPTTISFSEEIPQDEILKAYFNRYARASLVVRDSAIEYIISRKSLPPEYAPFVRNSLYVVGKK